VRIVWQHLGNLEKMIKSWHYAVISTCCSPVKPWISVYSSVDDTLGKHRVALDPHYIGPEVIKPFRFAIFPHSFHLPIDEFQGISQ
jgi:hypothetical protein